MNLSAVLAHIILREKLHIFGVLGCALCVVGSTTIVLHAPQEREIDSVIEVWNLATEPGVLLDWTVMLHYMGDSNVNHLTVLSPHLFNFLTSASLLQHSCFMRL